MSAPDYFPLAEGAVREYSSETAQGKGAFKVEVLSVATAGGKTVASCRRTTTVPGRPPSVALFEAVKDSKEVRSGAGTEFRFPVKIGTEWTRSPRRYWIEALDAAVETPAGKFEGCMRVAYLRRRGRRRVGRAVVCAGRGAREGGGE